MILSYILPIFLVLIILALAGFILSLRRKINDSHDQELDRKNSDIEKNISNQIQLLSSSFSSNLNSIQKSVDQRLGENTNRLDNASRSYAEVTAHLAKLQEQTQKVYEISKDVSSLQDILKPPKARGEMGESLLGNLLEQMLSRDNYDTQHQFKSGERVDAIVRLGKYLIPIDSKFPLENFRKYVGSKEDRERESHKKNFALDVKKHIDSISKKYILPDEGTIDYALMYIPMENVFNEIITCDFGNVDLRQYAAAKRVIPVSPNTLSAYLQTIVMGLKGMKIEENARHIMQNIKRLEVEFDKVKNDFVVLGSHLNNASKKYHETEKRFERFEMRLEKSRDKEIEMDDVALIDKNGNDEADNKG